jgi:hypothetical protein
MVPADAASHAAFPAAFDIAKMILFVPRAWEAWPGR